MYKERKEDLSVLKFIKDLFSPYPHIKVVPEFPFDEELSSPTIAVTNGDITYELLELGDDEMLSTRTWYFDVFTKDRNQRDEYVYRISDALRSKEIPVYDFGADINNPPQAGYCLSLINLRIVFVPSFSNEAISHSAFITATFEPTQI